LIKKNIDIVCGDCNFLLNLFDVMSGESMYIFGFSMIVHHFDDLQKKLEDGIKKNTRTVIRKLIHSNDVFGSIRRIFLNRYVLWCNLFDDTTASEELLLCVRL